MNFSAIESAIAAEAAAHAEAALALNPHGEAEFLEMGSARLVYSGVFSSVHGAYGLGLDGPLENRDFVEVERFFTRKDRAAIFWTTPFTDVSLLTYLEHGYRKTKKVCVHGVEPSSAANLPVDPFVSGPEHGAWSLAFAKTIDPDAKEANLLSVTKLHQKNTRFYMSGGRASYTFFQLGTALIPYPCEETLEQQKNEAAGFHSKALVLVGEGKRFPLLYERTLHEPV